MSGGIWGIGMGGGSGSGKLVVLDDYEASVDVATFDLTADTTNYRTLKLFFLGTTDAARNLAIRFNADSGNNYNYERINGSAAVLTSDQAANQAVFILGTSSATPVPFAFDYTIFNDGTIKTSLVGIAGDGNSKITQGSGYWNNTNKITSITILPTAGSIKSGSKAILYGLRA